jgi:hypothetical protein
MNDDDALHTKEEQLKNGTGNPLVGQLYHGSGALEKRKRGLRIIKGRKDIK